MPQFVLYTKMLKRALLHYFADYVFMFTCFVQHLFFGTCKIPKKEIQFPKLPIKYATQHTVLHKTKADCKG